MRRPLLAVLGAATLVLAALTTLPPAHADIGFSQQVRLTGDPTKGKGITRRYSSFEDGKGSCYWQAGQPQQSEGCWRRVGGGKITIMPKTYKLVESMRKDYYLIDITVSTKKIHGSKDFAYLDATIRSAGKTKIVAATYSLGKNEVSDCKRYPVNIAAGWGPVSAGTSVGSFTVNCHRTYITRKAVRRGQTYHVTNLNAVKNVTFQRFVIVPKGQRPAFKYSVAWPTDTCQNGTIPTGSSSVAYRRCTNSEASITRTVGTRGN